MKLCNHAKFRVPYRIRNNMRKLRKPYTVGIAT